MLPPPAPAVHTVCTRVCLCPCILINTLLTPRPRHINHETMENAVGGGPTGVDLSIPLSCIPFPRCVPRTPSNNGGYISLSLSRLPYTRAISPRKVSTASIYCEISRERARLYRAKRLPVEEPAVVDSGVTWLCGDSAESSRHFGERREGNLDRDGWVEGFGRVIYYGCCWWWGWVVWKDLDLVVLALNFC